MMRAVILDRTLLRIVAAPAESAVMAFGIAARGIARAAPADGDEALPSSEPYRFPCRSRADWPAFVRTLRDGSEEAWAK